MKNDIKKSLGYHDYGNFGIRDNWSWNKNVDYYWKNMMIINLYLILLINRILLLNRIKYIYSSNFESILYYRNNEHKIQKI